MTSRNTDVSNEAEQAGRYAGDVPDGTKILDGAVTDLRQAIIQTIGSSTEEVDRRMFRHHPVNLDCQVEAAGITQFGQVAEMSEGGVRLTGAKDLHVGARGTVRIDGLPTSIQFTVRGAEDDAFRLSFELDEAGKRGLRALIERASADSAAA